MHASDMRGLEAAAPQRTILGNIHLEPRTESQPGTKDPEPGTENQELGSNGLYGNHDFYWK